jgi:glycerol-3-phosphate dehydrogenase (NAD(P)+)
MTPEPIQRIAVIGTTSWGTTLAVHLARNHRNVFLGARSKEEAHGLEDAREHSRRLPGIPFPETLHVRIAPEAVRDADLVCFVVPSNTLTENARSVASEIPAGAVLLSATKGIEANTGRRMSELLAEQLPGHPIAVLSGPNLSREVANDQPGSTVIASTDAPLDELRDAFHARALRVYTSTDVVGVELGGALKNVVAIAGGMVDHFEFGDNAKAAVLTRGLAEITRLAVAAGADPITLQGLAGVGDLMASAYSPLARNRRLGELLAAGGALEASLASLGEVAEGATTIPAALNLAGKLNVELPITEALNSVLYDGVAPLDAVSALMAREPTAEIR